MKASYRPQPAPLGGDDDVIGERSEVRDQRPAGGRQLPVGQLAVGGGAERYAAWLRVELPGMARSMRTGWEKGPASRRAFIQRPM